MSSGTLKQSYTIPCSTAFRDAVNILAEQRKVNVGDIARSVMLVVPVSLIDASEDPGEPEGNDRETVILKSGPAKGRPWRRKPRLQLRMSPGHRIDTIRRALNLALRMASGELEVRVDDADSLAEERDAMIEAAKAEAAEVARVARQAAQKPAQELVTVQQEVLRQREEAERSKQELDRLKRYVETLAFEPLTEGVNTRNDALHIFGYPPTARPDWRDVRSKYRVLASIHHPDSNFGDHRRMTQLNAAMEILRGAA
jgi:hypothetical protein